MHSVIADRRSWRTSRVAAILIALLAVMLYATAAAAHNVTEGDAGYIQEIWG